MNKLKTEKKVDGRKNKIRKKCYKDVKKMKKERQKDVRIIKGGNKNKNSEIKILKEI